MKVVTKGFTENFMISLNVPNSQNLSGTVTVTCGGTPAPDSVAFYLDAETTPRSTDTAPPFTWLWNTVGVPNGNHTLKATAKHKGRSIYASLPIIVANGVAPPPVGVAPVNTGALPFVSGTPTQGQTLSTTPGGWSNIPTSYQYEFLRCDAAGVFLVVITGPGTVATYVLTSADVGKTIRSRVKAFNTYGGSLLATSAQTAVISALPPPSGLPFAEASLRTGFSTITVAAGEQSLGYAGSPVAGGNDVLINLQGIVRTVGSLLIFGSAGQRIKVINGHWNMTKPIDAAPYWRGGPRVRTSDGIGPEHISLTDMIVRGSSVPDAMAIAAGSQTKVTLQRARFESPYQTTGVNTAEPSEHPDAIHLQGNARVIEIGLTTLFASSVNAPNDGGKCIMLNDDWSPNYEALYLNKVNMRGQGDRTGTFLYQDNPTMDIYLTDVYAHKEGSGAFLWSGGSGLFYPNSGAGAFSWTSSGTAPNRIADWPDTASIYGVIKEGLPVSGDYSTRAHFGL